MFRILDHCVERNRAPLDFVYLSAVVPANNGDENLESHIAHMYFFIRCFAQIWVVSAPLVEEYVREVV